MISKHGKSSKNMFLVTVEAAGNSPQIPGTWARMTGGAGTSTVSRDYDGGARKADILSGPPEFADLELGRTYKPEKDSTWTASLYQRIGLARYTITKTPVDEDGSRVSDPIIYADCLLVGINSPDVDASSSDAAELTLTFANTGPSA